MSKLRLVLLAAGLTALAAGCKSSGTPGATATNQVAEPESNAPRLYVTNEISGDMSIIDTGTDKVIATIPLGTRPRGIHASPDHKTLYVALSGTPIAGPDVDESTLPPPDRSKDGIGVFDVKKNKLLKIIPGGPDPENFDISQDGKLLYISNEDVSAVSILDIASGKVLDSFKMGEQPEGVKVTPDGKLVYVTSEENGNVAVLDPAKKKIIATIKVGHRPRSIAFMPDGSRAYVNAENDGSVVVVNTKKRSMIKTIAIGKPGAIKPMGLLLSADAKKLYVSTGRGHQVFTIDTATDTVLGSVEVGQRPWGIALSPDGRTLYSANGPSNDVSVVDLANNTVTKKIPAGKGPWGLVVLER